LTRRADYALAGAATLFGSTFLVMQDAVRDVDPYAFLVARFGIGALLLAPVLLRRRSPGLLRHGGLAGLALAAGYVGQTVGLQYTTTSVSAFFTYLLVVIVPLLSAVLLRRPPLPSTLAGIVLATAGLFVMSGTGFALGRGELLTLLGAVAFAAHIVVLSEVARRHDVLALNAVQFATVAVVLLGPALLQGSFAFPASAWAAAAYTGVVVSVVAFGLQVWGQARVGPSRAALVLMLEPVVAAVIGRIDGEHLGAAGAVGAGLILAGILVCELAGPFLDRPLT
jgi:drug/metabolite transporter (DMT)-like permease